VEELATLIDTAEEKAAALKKAAEPFFENKPLSAQEVIKFVGEVEGASIESKAASKSCSDFIMKNSAELSPMKIPGAMSASAEAQEKKAKILHRLNECATLQIKVQAATSGQHEKAVKLDTAKKHIADVQATFKKYDKDKDGMLDRKEVQKMAKEKYSLDLAKDRLNMMWDVLVDENATGVKVGRMQEVITSIGMAREIMKDSVRVAERKEKERLCAEAKEALQEKFNDVKKNVDGVMEEVTALEDVMWLPTDASKALSSEAMLTAVVESEGLAKRLRASHDDAKKNGHRPRRARS